jgi:hypothetical protein
MRVASIPAAILRALPHNGSSMAIDHFRYDLLAQNALRGVVRTVLAEAARKGLPGDHHLYVTFHTQAPGVRISPRLREKYPEEMTIVFQHQFWDLVVSEIAFEVGMAFGGVAEKLVIPFDAIKSFFDPSVQFGLQFEPATEQKDEPTKDAPASAEPGSKSKSPRRPKPALSAPAVPQSNEPAPPTETSEPAADPDKPSSGAEVVRLDRFRKKK